MNKKENIILDAVIVNVIGHAAFDAVLKNGHHIVAFFSPAAGREGNRFSPGEGIQVEMSPYDMSKGRILVRNSG